MPEALARQAPHPLKTVVTVLSGAVCIPGRCTPARRCLAPGTRAATLTAFHAHVTPFPALGEHCCWDRDVHRNLTDALLPPPTTVLPPSFPGLNPPPPSRLLSTIPPPSLPFPRSSPQRLRALAGFAPSKLHCARPLCVSCGRAPWACVCARREASGAVWYMSVCAAVSLGGYEKNKTLIAIATQHAETYGDNRSPIRAAFQNSPNTLVASVCVCVCACVRARSLRFSPNDTAPIVRGVCAAGAHGLRKACIAARARLGIQARSAHADGHAHRQGRCCGQYPVLFRSMMEGKLALR